MSNDFTIRLPKPNLRGNNKEAAFRQFAEDLQAFSESLDLGFKVSARGWCYIFENAGVIDKSRFEKVEKLINECRKEGYLHPKFVADDESRVAMVFERLDYPDPAKEAIWLLDDFVESRIDITPRNHFGPTWTCTSRW